MSIILTIIIDISTSQRRLKLMQNIIAETNYKTYLYQVKIKRTNLPLLIEYIKHLYLLLHMPICKHKNTLPTYL